MNITNEMINEIRNKVDIVSVISNYLPLTQRGKNYFGVCPFHDDHSPSMSVSPDKQIFTCFSCGATGNVFTFVADYEHIGFYDAVRLLGSKVGYNLGNSISKNNNKYADYYDIYNLSCKFYQNNLNTSLGKNAREYLEKRKIDNDTIKKFKIGLALPKVSLTDYLLAKKYSLKNLNDMGLSNDNGMDLFVNRIIFPLYDLEGNTVSNWNKDEDNDGLLDVQEQYNQFVWIPVKKGEYQRNYSYPIFVFNSEGYYHSDTTPVNSMCSDIGYLPNIIQPSVDSATSNENSERENVERAGGFYISRYEAGNSGAASETTNGKEKPVSKQKSYVYNYITQEDAKKISKNMYNNGGARSALCSGIQWDCALNFVNGKTDAMNNVYLVRGYNENRHMNSVQKTGINNYDKVSNIYDLEGNCAEFVAERNTLNDYVLINRGGYYYKGSGDWSSNRATIGIGTKVETTTFRMVLYVI